MSPDSIPVQSCPGGICLFSQTHYDVQMAHHRVSLATFLQFPSSSFHTLNSLASPTVVFHDTPSNSPCLIKCQLPYRGWGKSGSIYSARENSLQSGADSVPLCDERHTER